MPFEGFGEIAMHYARNYDIVSRLAKAFYDEARELAMAVQDQAKKLPWYGETFTAQLGGNYLNIVLPGVTPEDSPVIFGVSFSPREIGKNTFLSSLRLGKKVANPEIVKKAFEERASKQIRDKLQSGQYVHYRKDKTLIKRTVTFEPQRIVEKAIEELDLLAEFANIAKEIIESES